MKKLLSLALFLALLPTIALASPVTWERSSDGYVRPLFYLDTVKANIFTATSTTAHSAFPFASTTQVTATSLCLIGDTCRTTWPTSGAGGTGTVSTSTNESAGTLAYWTSNSATPALLGKVSTSTLSASSPLTGSVTQIGSGGSLGIQNASASQAGAETQNEFNYVHSATTTYSGVLVYTGSTNAVTCTSAANGVAGCLTAADWGLLHTATTTFGYPLTYTGSTNQVTLAATSTFYGTGTAGQVLMWCGTSNVPCWAATSSVAAGTASSTLLIDNNTFSGNNFFSASTTFTKVVNLLNASSSLNTFGTVWLPSLATPAGTFIAVDPNGKIIATSTPTGASGVTSVGATFPIQSSGGLTPNISSLFSTTSDTGLTRNQLVYTTPTGFLLTAATSAATVSSPLTGAITVVGTGQTIGIQNASASQGGAIQATDYTRLYAATTTFSSPLSYSVATNAVTCPTCIVTIPNTDPFTHPSANVSATTSGMIITASTTVLNLTTYSQTATTTIANAMTIGGPNSYLLVATSTPSFGQVTFDNIDSGGKYNGPITITAYNDTAGNCAQANMIFANDGASPALGHFGLIGRNSSGYTGIGCPAGGVEPADSMHLVEQTGSMGFSLGTTTNPASAFMWNTQVLGANAGERMRLTGNGYLGIGTSTPYWRLTVSSSTAPQLALSDGNAADFPWTFRSIANSLYFATSTATATSTSAALSINSNGLVTLTSLASGSLLCVHASATGQLSTASADCGTGGGGSDPFTHPIANSFATTSVGILNTGGLIINAASSTINGNATTTGMFEAATASSTNLYGAGLQACNGVSSAITWNGGKFGCHSITASAGAAGSATQVQFNTGGALDASSTFTFASAGAGLGTLTVGPSGGPQFFTSFDQPNDAEDFQFFDKGGSLGEISADSGNSFIQVGDESNGSNLALRAYNGTIAVKAATANSTGILDFSALNTSDKTFTFPNQGGTVCLVGVLCDGSGSGGDPFTHPSATESATTSQLDMAGFISSASSTITSTTTMFAEKLQPITNTSASVSTGGAFNLTNTANDGAGMVLFTNHGASATGRLFSVDCGSLSFDQNCVNIQGQGTASVLNVQGAVPGLGVMKIAAISGGASTNNSSMISIDSSVNSFQGQGLFIKGNSATTTSLLNVQDSGSNTAFKVDGNRLTTLINSSTTHATISGSTWFTGLTGPAELAIDSTGKVYTAATTTASNPTGSIGSASATNGTAVTYMRSDAVPACTAATASVPGCITAADWSTFNGKVSSSSLAALDSFTHPAANTSATTSAMLITASTTIGNGTQANGLTIFGGATTTLNALFLGTGTSSFAGNVTIGTTSNATSSSTGGGAALYISNAINNFAGLVIRTWTNVVNAFTIFNAAGTPVFNVDTTATRAGLLVGTSTAWNATTSVMSTIVNPPLGAGAVATTTLMIGDPATTTSASCIAVNSSAGKPFGIYVNSAGTLTTVAGGCP